MTLTYLLALVIFSLVDVIGAELPTTDPLSGVTLNIRSMCLARAQYCRERLPKIGMLTPDTVRTLPLSARGWYEMAPSDVVRTMQSSCSGSVDRYSNIIAICDQYAQSKDIKYLVLISYLLRHARQFFDTTKKDAFYVDTWKAFDVYEKEHLEEMSELLSEKLRSCRGVSLLLNALKNVSIERAGGISQLRITTNDSISKAFYTFQERKREWSVLGGDPGLLMQHTASVTYSFSKFISLSLSLKDFSFGMLPLTGDRIQALNAARRFTNIEFIKTINAGVLYALECDPYLRIIQEVVRQMDSVLENLRREKQKRDAIKEKELQRAEANRKRALKGKMKETKAEAAIEVLVGPIDLRTTTEVSAAEPLDPQQYEVEEILNATDCLLMMNEEQYGVTQATAQAIVHSANVTMNPRELSTQEIMDGFIFEKTKLYDVLTSIQRGERVKQHKFLSALRSFAEQQELNKEIAGMRATTGSILKLTSETSTTLHTHHKGKDDTVQRSDWLYTRVVEWLQRSGISIESARSREVLAVAATAA